MKSSGVVLRNRGFLSDSEYRELKSSLGEYLSGHLHSSDAFPRTFSIRSIRETRNVTYVKEICELLQIEDRLYTRIEICNYLSEVGEPAMPHLLPLLGKIGNNQHKEIANVDLGKKTFPLPRDIVARILVRIGHVVFPHLEHLLIGQDIQPLSEVIDVIGHISWTSGDSAMEDVLLHIHGQNSRDLIRWKLIRAFQAFNSTRVIDALEKTIANPNENVILVNEAKRSLRRIRMISLGGGPSRRLAPKGAP